MTDFIGFEDIGSIRERMGWNPRIVSRGISFPFDIPMESFADLLVFCDGFYFVFFFSADEIWGWKRE